ncbi:MAG: TetR family transcriptional regulator [Chitinispirillaceae bacterium]|nr:TetR family transcriptional regulator [Chitinispirillaceae bacterium]
MRKTKKDTELSKLSILLAAEEEFCRHGFTAANMDSIAKAAGLTKGAIFWHYKSKADLFKATIKRATGRLTTIFQETFSSSRPIMEKCREIIKRIKKDNAFEVLVGLSNAENAGDIPKGTLNEELSDIFKIAVHSFSEAKKRGELSPDADILNILVTIMLIMNGFAKRNDLKSMIATIGGHIDDEHVINAMFDGLLSFQTKS